MLIQHRCLYCDVFLPKEKVRSHMKCKHDVDGNLKIIEEFTVRVMG